MAKLNYDVTEHGIRFKRWDRHVVVDPEYAAGEPTLRGRRLLVAAIAGEYESGTPESNVAQMWGLSPEAVTDAIHWSKVA